MIGSVVALTCRPRTSFAATRADHATVYEQICCARGEMEHRIKEPQLYLFADRTSDRARRVNQMRLWCSPAACLLLAELRRLGLAGSEMARRPLRHRSPMAAQDRRTGARQRPPGHCFPCHVVYLPAPLLGGLGSARSTGTGHVDLVAPLGIVAAGAVLGCLSAGPRLRRFDSIQLGKLRRPQRLSDGSSPRQTANSRLLSQGAFRWRPSYGRVRNPG